MQLPSSNNQPTSELDAEVENLSNIASNIAIDSEMQAKIQNLLVQIKTSLRQQKLTIEMQRELAKLLSLMSRLDYSNPQQIDILDLAISILLENKEETSLSNQKSNFPNKVSDKSDKNCGNLVFVREARRQIAIQSQEYPHPLSVIIKGTGGAYNRLLSGLSWFFIIFVVFPLLGIGAAFILFNIVDFTKQDANQLQQQTIEFKSQLNKKDEEIRTAKELSNTFRASLSKVNDELKFLTDEEAEDNNVGVPLIKIQQIQENIEKELAFATKKENAEPSSNLETPNRMTTTNNQTNQNNNNDESDIEPDNQNPSQLILFTDWFVKQDLFFICLAVSMGALGSAISVIVRANKFIEQGKEGESDLFFTGFFRPIVGMSFAIFAVALIESGVFSGIFRIAERENRNVYLYMAIAFVAGFSERLVEDVVLKTENTLTGFNSRQDKSNK
ncbi:hypothetical protein Riv7116_3201 [Rivularia sp. PCC 7116]|uniref:hypothetical protein n=1 Tax=Rivularia sp. PCC 7116 TaxID=373994 RepID=UPI00029EC80B|nr:hypothetical protein [Rivularia sp. PCC 7116]AFY55672.1 hypothetical protein Riv7116_3201 [Rivularia sp. PCC 7116]